MNAPSPYLNSTILSELLEALNPNRARIHIDGLSGSLPSFLVATLAQQDPTLSQLIICPSKEEALYFATDLQALLDADKSKLFPSSYRRAYHYDPDQTDNANIILRGIDRLGLLNDLTQIISHQLNVDMKMLTFKTNENIFDGEINLRVHDRDDVQVIIDELKALRGIQEIHLKT